VTFAITLRPLRFSLRKADERNGKGEERSAAKPELILKEIFLIFRA